MAEKHVHPMTAALKPRNPVYESSCQLCNPSSRQEAEKVSPPEEKDDNLSQLSGQGEKSSSCEEQEDAETEEQQARGMGSLTLAQPLRER